MRLRLELFWGGTSAASLLTLLHGTPEQLSRIRDYLGDVMDDAGVENKKQVAVYRNRRFWHVLVLCHRQRKDSPKKAKFQNFTRNLFKNPKDPAKCAPQRLYLAKEDMGDEPPKSSRKYRWAATSANILYVLSLIINVWKSRARQLRCFVTNELKQEKTYVFTGRTLRMWVVPQLLEVDSDERQEMIAADGSGVLRSFMAGSFWNRFGSYLKDCATVFYRGF